MFRVRKTDDCYDTFCIADGRNFPSTRKYINAKGEVTNICHTFKTKEEADKVLSTYIIAEVFSKRILGPVPTMKPKGPALKKYDISDEKVRVYSYIFFSGGRIEVVIHHPKTLFLYGKGHAFHRVWDGEEVNLCHAPGPIRDHDHKIIGLCHITWQPNDVNDPCKF